MTPAQKRAIVCANIAIAKHLPASHVYDRPIVFLDEGGGAWSMWREPSELITNLLTCDDGPVADPARAVTGIEAMVAGFVPGTAIILARSDDGRVFLTAIVPERPPAGTVAPSGNRKARRTAIAQRRVVN